MTDEQLAAIRHRGEPAELVRVLQTDGAHMIEWDWKQTLEVFSPAAVIFIAGRIAQQITTLRKETEALGPIVKSWEALLVRVGSLETALSKLLSDHRQLKDRVGDTREKLASIHDVGE